MIDAMSSVSPQTALISAAPITRKEGLVPEEILITNEGRRLTELVVDFILSYAIAIIGVVSNVLVLVVFTKQGFKESVNISMTTIAIWDLIKCVCATMQRMAGPMRLWSPAVAESWTNISVAVFNYVICDSSYVTSVLAAYVAVERCLCVMIPFKVKWLLTPKVTLFASVLVSVVVFGAFSIVFAFYDIYWVYDDRYNATVAVYKQSAFYRANDGPLFLYYNMSGILWPLVSFLVIVVATSIIVFKLRESSKFRLGQAEVKADTAQQLSARDKQVVKMLVVIIAVYVINLSPRIALYMAKYFIYEFYFLRKFHNIFMFVCYFLYIFDLSNGAINFFIFYAMSSSFKATFRKMSKIHKNLAVEQVSSLNTNV